MNTVISEVNPKENIIIKGAKYVSKDENAWAPAHSLCKIPKKFAIWPRASLKWLGAVLSTLPLTPLNPSSSNTLSDQPAQYPLKQSKSWIW